MQDQLEIITMSDVETEDVCWLWKPYIPMGKISMVQGDPGDGKTTMVLAIAAALTVGAPLPGSDSALPLSSVIYQTAEDGLADTIKPRLVQLGADCGRVHVINEDETALSFSDERIERAILRTGAKLFILDPLQAYLGGIDMHRANDVRPVFKQLGLVADRTGCAIVIIGHLNKGGAKSQYRGLGSIDIHAAARSVLTVGKIPVDESMRAVVHGKSNLAPHGNSLAFGLDPTSGFTWLGDYEITLEELLAGRKPKQENQLGRAQEFVAQALANGAAASVELFRAAEEQGLSPKTLNRAKGAMGIKSFRQGGQWYWSLPGSEGGQGGQTSLDGSLTILEKADGARVCEGSDGEDGQPLDVTTLTNLEPEAV